MLSSERFFAAGFGLILLGAVIYPAAQDPPVDSFPLSNYPMFSKARHTKAVELPHVIAFDDAGGGRPVPPQMLGSVEVMQALRTIEISVNRGPTAADELCRRTAAIVRDTGGSWSNVVRLEVRVDVFDAIEYFEKSRTPKAAHTYAECTIEEAP